MPVTYAPFPFVHTSTHTHTQGCHGTGEQGIWIFIFPDRENATNFPKIIEKKFLTQAI